MTAVFLAAALGVVLMSMPYFGRLFAGPTVFDRILALNGLGTKISVLVVLVGLWYERLALFVDIALGLFLLNLVVTLLVARYVREKGRLS